MHPFDKTLVFTSITARLNTSLNSRNTVIQAKCEKALEKNTFVACFGVVDLHDFEAHNACYAYE
jgi:hypothetical protein